MFGNFLIVAFRNLLRNKIYVAINTLGMGLSMACCLTAYLLIAYNIEFNSYFDDKGVENVVKVIHHQMEDDGSEFKELMTPAVMGPLVTDEISGIQKFSRYTSTKGSLSTGDEAFFETIRFADSEFFEMIDIRLVSGSYENFKQKNSIFLSASTSKKYFADEEPVGKTMRVKFGEELREVIVGGVLKDIPLNTSFTIKALMRMEVFLTIKGVKMDDWKTKTDVSLLLELSDVSQISSIEAQLLQYAEKRNEKITSSKSTEFKLIPFNERVSRNDIRQSDMRLSIPKEPLVVFSALGAIILLIACFNLTNTTMALTGRRLKEIGVRKVIGSSRWQIIGQFLLEMLVTILLAVVASFIFAQLMIPEFAAMWRIEYGLEDLDGTNIIIVMLGLLFICAILAGIYPALMNSRFSPIQLFRSKTHVKGTNALTRILLTFQFALSVIMLCGGIILSQNIAYQNEIHFGYDHKNLIKVKVSGEQTFNRLNNSLSTNPKIKSISSAANHIGPYSSYRREVQIDSIKLITSSYSVGPGYFKTIGMRLIEGRTFQQGSYKDMESSVIVDLNFVKNNGLENPVGTIIKVDGHDYQVIGVVRNHLSSLKDKKDEHYIYLMARPEQYSWMVLNTEHDNRKEVLKTVEEQWKTLFPDDPYQADLQEDVIYSESKEYNSNLRNIFLFLTVLGSLLSASGIYALANLNAQKRSKEIGVRKVLGASVGNIIRMVNKEFVLLLLIALVLGSTASYIFIEELLKSLYQQYQPMSVVPLFFGGIIILAVGLFTTSTTIYRTAVMNPTNTLKES